MLGKALAISAMLFLVVLTTSVFAQPSGPGYGMGPGGGYGYGPGYGYGMGPGMMGPGWGGGYGMGPQMMGPGWGQGYGMGPGMMGPGYGYGPSGEQPNLSPEEREARAKAYIEEYIRRYLPGYRLEKKPSQEKK